MKLLLPALMILMGYLLGSIPTAYMAGRWLKGIDLRRYGSGTVSGSMVWEHVARWVVVPAGLFDVFKAAFPTWLALRLDLSPWIAAAAGLAAAVGHNWPLYLRFTGGRGLSCFLGIWLALFPWGVPWVLGFLAVGFLLGDSAPWALASLVTLPLLSRGIDGPVVVLPAAGAMLLLTLVKRLEANRRPLPPASPERRRVILRRLLLDRDIASHPEWIQRRPDREGQARAE
jgi:glycerol-3-phosphate acyltransferase PlsY